MGLWSRAKEYVACSRAYILGHMAENDRIQLENELYHCQTEQGNPDYITQYIILRHEAQKLWDFKQAYQHHLEKTANAK